MHQLTDGVPGGAGVPEGMVGLSRRWTVLSSHERQIWDDGGITPTGVRCRFDRPAVRGLPVCVPDDVIRTFVGLRRERRGAVRDEQLLEAAEAIVAERLPAEPRAP